VYGIGSVGARPVTAAMCLGAALAVAGLLAAASRRTGARQIPRTVIGSPQARAANLVAFTFFAGVSGSTFVISLYLQGIEHYGPFEAGAVFLPTALLSIVAAPAGARLVTRWGARAGLVLGAALVALATAGYALTGLVGPPLAVIIPVSLVTTLGIALAYPGAMITAVGGVPARDHSIASALVLTTQQIGGAVGVAVATVVASAVNGGTLSDGPGDLAGLRAGLAACAIVAALGTAAWALLKRP
jgi:MFS family permease